jgi:N-acetylneuraminic acid mutarotase
MRPRASRAPLAFIAAVALTLTGCGGHSSSSTATSTTYYTVGGTITGLTVGSVVLANGTATVTVAADATNWSFPVTFTPGSSYSVTVQTQPSGEQCEVASGGSGMNTGDVDDVVIVCGFGQWTWKDGATLVNGGATYGTQGTAAAGNTPGARYSTTSWTDASGNFWLFGGVGYDAAGGTGYLNDLWQYSPSTAQWTWVGGVSADNASGTYGTQGTAAAGNVPGARYAASSWTDSSGNLWLFGGYGYDSTGDVGSLNDLWRFTPSTGMWTWVSGGNVANATAAYGTLATAAAGNVPGARYSASSWIDSSGNLLLFGGVGYGSTSGVAKLNDLWQYSPSSGLWTWIGGNNTDNASGVYGTQGTAAAGNVPGARYAANSWIDTSGNLWLFGGFGYDSNGTAGRLNDLWQYTPSSAQWTWIGGEDAANATGVYGALGVASALDVPGARQGASSWIDTTGNLWLFGGLGYDSAGAVGNLNDLWQYSPSTKAWTWTSGGNAANASGAYGTEGTGSVVNVLGGRNSTGSWVDSSGNFWLFGGNGYDSNGNLGYLNDLWQYNPTAGN